MASTTVDTNASHPAPTARIFISYSRKDMDFADRLDGALKARGFEPLIDRTKIYSFEDWWKRIQALIGQADTIIFVLSPDALDSDICRQEVAFAASLHKRQRFTEGEAVRIKLGAFDGREARYSKPIKKNMSVVWVVLLNRVVAVQVPTGKGRREAICPPAPRFAAVSAARPRRFTDPATRKPPR